MPKANIRESFEMQTRDRYTKVDCEFGLTVDGREIPNMSVLGDALEQAIKLIQDRVLESYKVVPARNEFEQDGTQKADPVGATTLAAERNPEPPVRPVTTVPFGN